MELRRGLTFNGDMRVWYHTHIVNASGMESLFRATTDGLIGPTLMAQLCGRTLRLLAS